MTRSRRSCILAVCVAFLCTPLGAKASPHNVGARLQCIIAQCSSLPANGHRWPSGASHKDECAQTYSIPEATRRTLANSPAPSPTATLTPSPTSTPQPARFFGWVDDIAVDGHGNLYAADFQNELVDKFSPSGRLLKSWYAHCPAGVAVGASGYVYTASYIGNFIQKFNPNGRPMGRWTSSRLNGGLNKPTHLRIGPDRDVYIADMGGHRVVVVSHSGKVVRVFGGLGETSTGLSKPSGLALDRFGNLYVTTSGDDRVWKFSPKGAIIAAWGAGILQFHDPEDIAVDTQGNVWVADRGNSRVLKFDPSGRQIGRIGWAPGSKPGEFLHPIAIAIDPSGHLYVDDQENHRIQKFTLNGAFLGTIQPAVRVR